MAIRAWAAGGFSVVPAVVVVPLPSRSARRLVRNEKGLRGYPEGYPKAH